MIILGIDPGLATMGYGVIQAERGNFAVVDYGVVTTPKDLTLPQRLARIEEGVTALIEKFRPENIAVEELFFSKNITNGIMVAEARGVILLTANKLVGEEVYEYTPNQIKQAIRGTAERTRYRCSLWCRLCCASKKCRARTMRRTHSQSHSVMGRRADCPRSSRSDKGRSRTGRENPPCRGKGGFSRDKHFV